MTLPYKPRQALPFAPGAAPDESGPSVAHDAQDASQVAIPQPRRMSRKCVICGTEKRPEWAESEFCTFTCKKRHESRASKGFKRAVATGTTGAVAELFAAADLMRRGCEVFRAQSPNASCDLVVIAGMTIARVEVRSGTRGANGRLVYANGPRDVGRQDAFAVVLHGDKPELFYKSVTPAGVALLRGPAFAGVEGGWK